LWDYYTVLIETDEFIACEQIEELCDFVRGKSLEQERLAQNLHRSLGVKNKLTLLGRHGQNTELKVVIE
jgi:hypothetical protein